MVAKLLVHAPTRAAAIARMKEALDATRIVGVKTNLSLHRRITSWETFTSGDYNTTSLETAMAAGEL
jgi:biotin carboxylase